MIELIFILVKIFIMLIACIMIQNKITVKNDGH